MPRAAPAANLRLLRAIFIWSPVRSVRSTSCSIFAEGFYVTELMGHGVNPVTGDYSQAAAGFWIENGFISFPVSEMTIAGNLMDMFLNLTPANDLVFRRGVDAPTVRIEGMTTAGV